MTEIKQLIKVLCVSFILLFSPNAQANTLENYERAKLEYINAIVCLATYSDRAGYIARAELADAGWFMNPYKEYFQGVDVKFFFAENDDIEPGKEIYILAVTGTENIKDVAIDLNFSKVLFGGNTPAEFTQTAIKSELTSKDPMVHRGFNKYAQTAFFTREEEHETYGEFLANLLKDDSDRKLYIVGHSLGGAVATIGAARLLSLGVDPAQIEVITFGAPAVGNTAFAKQYGSKINLTRVVIQGDPAKGILQAVAGGYTQFGKQSIWKENHNMDKQSHAMVVYVDSAIRNFYDTREALIEEGIEIEEIKKVKQGTSMVYVAPVVATLPEEIAEDAYYMKETIKNALKSRLDGYVMAEGERATVAEELQKAKAAGCDWLILSEVKVDRMQKLKYDYYVGFQEDIYWVEDGSLKGALSSANGTFDFTPIQANLHNATSVKEERERILGIVK